MLNVYSSQSFGVLRVQSHMPITQLLPSATKLRRLCFYRCLSVHKRGGVHVPWGAWSWGGAWSGGRGTWSLGGIGIPACTEADPFPGERRLLLCTVGILLECILVRFYFKSPCPVSPIHLSGQKEILC